MANEAIFKVSLQALTWNYAGAVVKALSGLAIGIVMARILGPEPYGLVAAAWLVIGFGNMLADSGFGAALIQQKEISPRDVRFAFGVHLLLGALFTTLGVAGAPLVGAFFRRPDLVPVFHALAWVFLLQAGGQTATSLLKRNLRFRELQIAQVSGQIAGYVGLGIPLALFGFGVWSLVAAQLTQTFVTSVLTYRFVRHGLQPCARPDKGRLIRFGLTVILVNIANWTTSNLASAIIGRAFGAVWLGLFQRAAYLTSAPMHSIVPVLQGVLFPASAKVQNNDAALRKGYLAALCGLSLLLLPMLGGLAGIAHTAIDALYGERWLDVSPLLPPVALAVAVEGMMALSGPVIWGKGRVELELSVQLVTAGIAAVALLGAARISVVAVVWTLLAVQALRFLLVTSALARLIALPPGTLARTLLGSVAAALWTAAGVRLTDEVLIIFAWPAAARLAAAVLAGLIGLLLFISLFPRLSLSPELSEALDRVAKAFPVPMQRIVYRVRGLWRRSL